MFSPRNPEDLRAMLLHMAAASVGVPEGRLRVARYLRAALALVEDDEGAIPPVRSLSPGAAKALEELAFSLSMAADHAAALAERAGLTGAPPSPR